MKTFYLLLLFITSTSALATTNPPLAPLNGTPNTVGSTFNVTLPESDAVLKVNLWLPNESHDTPMPLLVVLDGQRYFNYAVSMHHMMQQYKWSPPFAVLGIETSERRWSTLMGQRQIILQALKQQVFPQLQQHYPVSNERILFGWEAAGGFTLRTLIDEPELFSGYIAASPSPLFGDYFPTLRSDHEAMMKAIQSLSQPTHLYVASGKYDFPQQTGIDTLAQATEKLSRSKLRYTFTNIADASHASLGFEALLNGMRDYFFYFDKPTFADLNTFYEMGGNEYLDFYFTKQAEQYKLDQEKIAQNRFKALRKLSLMIVMDNDVVQLKRFLKQQGEDFLERSHLNHIYVYGMSMLSHNELDDAEAIFQYLKARHPEHARPINGLGLVAKRRGDQARAIQLFEQAVELGTKNNDFRLPEYQQNLPNTKVTD